jgi:molybdate transport system substrate-binding protein
VRIQAPIKLGEVTAMKRWLSGIAVVTLVVLSAYSALSQGRGQGGGQGGGQGRGQAAPPPPPGPNDLIVKIVGRGDDGFKELIAKFEMRTGQKVSLTFPAFIASRDTIVKGEPFDVGIVEFPHDEAVRASGNVVPGSETLVATGWMAVAVKKGAPKPDISTPAAVKKMLLNAKSIAYPDPDNGNGASGVNAEMMIRRLGIYDAVKAKTTLTQGGGRAMALAASGEAEIGMTYYIGMYENPAIDIVGTLPGEICPPMPLIGFISSKSTHAAAAKQLLTFLTSPEAAPTYKKYQLAPGY